jgi:hypothetical protein
MRRASLARVIVLSSSSHMADLGKSALFANQNQNDVEGGHEFVVLSSAQRNEI